MIVFHFYCSLRPEELELALRTSVALAGIGAVLALAALTFKGGRK